MGKERISSQEIADYTNINATQIRRDLSNFGKFGKRGVGYSIDSLLVGDPQDPAHAGPAQHRARRRRAARPGDRQLGDLRRARHQHRSGIRRRRRRRSGSEIGSSTIDDERHLKDVVREKNIVVGVLAVPAVVGAEGRRRSRRRRRPDHLQLLGSVARRPRRRHRAHLEPCGRAAARPLLPPDVELPRDADPALARLPARRHGSNVYTRALAREWSRAGHEVVVVCQEREPEQFDLGGATVVTPELPGGALPVFVLDRYAGLEPKLLQDFTRTSSTPTSRRTRPRCARCFPPTSSSRTTCCSARRSVRQPARRSASRRTARSSSTRCAGGPELERWGAETLAQADVTYVGSAHIRQVLEDVVGQVDRRAGGAAGCRRRRVQAAGSRRGARRPARGSAARSAEPRERRGAAARRRQRREAGGLPRRGCADGRLLREADRAERRAGVARGDGRDRRPPRDRRLRAVPRGARSSWRRPAHFSQGRSSTGISFSCCHSRT